MCPVYRMSREGEGEEGVIVRLMKRGARVYTCVGPYERHEAWTQK